MSCLFYFILFFLQPEVWPDYGKNQLSVAELWMGMFRYYTEQFDFKEEVVCIRQHATLTRFEKLWNGRCIAIEGELLLKWSSCLLEIILSAIQWSSVVTCISILVLIQLAVSLFCYNHVSCIVYFIQ